MRIIRLIRLGILEFIILIPLIMSILILICGLQVDRFYFFLSIEYSYEKLKSLTDICDETTAVIIPAFFHTGWTIANGTFEEQVQS